MFNIAVTEEQEKKFDFAACRADDHAFLGRANSRTLNKAEDIARLRIIAGSGTRQERLAFGQGRFLIAFRR